MSVGKFPPRGAIALTLDEVFVKEYGIVLLRATVSGRTFQVENLLKLAAVEEVLHRGEELLSGSARVLSALISLASITRKSTLR